MTAAQDAGAVDGTSLGDSFDAGSPIGDSSDGADVEVASDADGPTDSGGPLDADTGPPPFDWTPYLCVDGAGETLPVPAYDACEPEPLATIHELKPTVCAMPPHIEAVPTHSVILDPWFQTLVGVFFYDALEGAIGLVRVGEHDVVLVGVGHSATPFAGKRSVVLARFNEVGEQLWAKDFLPASWDLWKGSLKALSRTASGTIAVLAESYDGPLGDAARDLWVFGPEGEPLSTWHAPDPAQWFLIEGAAPSSVGQGVVSLGAILETTPEEPCIEQVATEFDALGSPLWEKPYTATIPDYAPKGLYSAESTLLSIPGCGYLATGRLAKGGFGRIHALRLDTAGTPVARWVYGYGEGSPSVHHLSAFAGDVAVVAAHSIISGNFNPTTHLLRFNLSTGAPLSLTAFPYDFSGKRVSSLMATDSGAIVLGTNYYSTTKVSGETTSVEYPLVHVLSPDGCPVATYAFTGLGDTDDTKPRVVHFVSITRLGDTSFVAVGRTYLGPPEAGASNSRLYYFELPALAELEAQLAKDAGKE